MRRRGLLLAITLAGIAAAPASAGSTPTPTVLRADGIGPLTLGMDRTAALATGWLVHRGRGCPLGGTPPITYRFGGSVPSALRGGVEFVRGKLTDLAVSRGVRTEVGVTVGGTVARMLERYRAAGFTAEATRSPTFGGTFVQISQGGKDVLGAFAETRTKKIGQLSLPAVVTCD